MGFRTHQKTTAGSYTDTINSLTWEVVDYEGTPRLRLALQRGNSDYVDYYSGGRANTIKVSKDGLTWTPKDFAFNGKCMAIWFLNGLVEAVEAAGMEYTDESLKDFQGLRVRTETREYETNINGKSLSRPKPYVVAVLSDDGNGEEEARPRKPNGAMTESGTEEVMETMLRQILEAHDGELAVTEIKPAIFKDLVGPDYTKRKALTQAMLSDDFLESQTVAELENGVLTLR